MKRFFAVLTAAALMLSLSGCAMTMLRQVYENQTGETLEVKEGTLVTEYTYSLLHTQTEYADGRTTRIEYEYKDAKDPNDPSRIIRIHTHCVYYENGKKTGTETYIRDDHGNPLSISRDWEGGEPETFEYTYDENGTILTETAYLNGEKNYRAEYSYDPHGNLTEKRIITDRQEAVIYTYDDQNRITEETHHLDDSLLDRTATEYADNGRQQKVTFYDSEGAVTGYEEYTFDQKSSKETVREYSGDGTLKRYLVNSYDVNDHLIYQEVYSPEDELLCVTNWYIVRGSHTYMVYD